jgi:hypothetical protein
MMSRMASLMGWFPETLGCDSEVSATPQTMTSAVRPPLVEQGGQDQAE